MGHEGHEHDHHHPHEHERVTLEGDVLFLDAPSGLAGDMIIAALADLGVPRDVVTNAVHALGCGGFHVHWGTRTRSGIVATAFDVHVDGAQRERTYRDVRALIEASALGERVKRRALHTFERLARAEAKVHKMPIDDVHFHEVGAIDAIVDVVGSAAAIEHLGAREIFVSPLPMGRGFVKAQHGTLPLPAPATVECLAGLETFDAGLDFEFVTPTGAAIVGASALRSVRWPRMKPLRVGWGAGRAELADRPNLLRAVLGQAGRGEHAAHVVLECNLDDATGELVGWAIEAALAAGALDAWAAPITMKKGRPAVTLAILARAEDANPLAELVLRETTSLGVRRYDVERVERPRRTISVETKYGAVPVKIAEGPFGPPQLKPEYETCAALARAQGVPVREVIRAALAAVPTSP